MKCFACNQYINKKGLGYDIETLKTYCMNRSSCKNPSAIPAHLVEMKDSSLKTEIIENYSKDVAESLNKMIGKTSSARLLPYMAMHLAKTAKENNLHSVNETLLFIIERDFSRFEIDTPIEGIYSATIKVPKAPIDRIYNEIVEEIEPPDKYELFNEGQLSTIFERDPITNPEPIIVEVEPEPTPVEPEVVEVEEPKEEEVDEFEF